MHNRDDYMTQHIKDSVKKTEATIEKILAEVAMEKKKVLHNQRDLLEVKQKAEQLLTQINNARRGIHDLEEQYTEHKKIYDDGRKDLTQQERGIKMLSDQIRGLQIEREKLLKKLTQITNSARQEEAGTRY